MRTGSSAGTRWIVIALASLVAVLASVLVSAQTYQGGMRGVVKDAQGVIPGVEVTLVNEDTNAVRTVDDQRSRRVRVPQRAARHLHRPRRAGRLQDRRAQGAAASPRSRHRAWTSRSRSARSSEQITVTARDAARRARDGHAWRRRMTAAQITALPIFGRNTFYAAISTPGVIQTGDPQFVRYQDQSGASLLSLGGGPRRGNAYLHRRRVDHRLAQSRVVGALDRSASRTCGCR